MREVAYLEEGGQVVFEAPFAGIYRFIAVLTSGGATQFWTTGPVQVIDLGGTDNFRMFAAKMDQGDQLFHAHAACVLTGAREPDEVPPEE